jgi:hypothetical protein
MQRLEQLYREEGLHFVESLPPSFPEEPQAQRELYRRVKEWFERSSVLLEPFGGMKMFQFWQKRKAFPSPFNPFYEDENLGLKYLAFLNRIRQVAREIYGHTNIPPFLSYPQPNFQDLEDACRRGNKERVKEILIQGLVDVNDINYRNTVLQFIFDKEIVGLFVQAGLDLKAFGDVSLSESHQFFLLLKVGVFVDDAG